MAITDEDLRKAAVVHLGRALYRLSEAAGCAAACDNAGIQAKTRAAREELECLERHIEEAKPE